MVIISSLLIREKTLNKAYYDVNRKMKPQDLWITFLPIFRRLFAENSSNTTEFWGSCGIVISVRINPLSLKWQLSWGSLIRLCRTIDGESNRNYVLFRSLK